MVHAAAYVDDSGLERKPVMMGIKDIFGLRKPQVWARRQQSHHRKAWSSKEVVSSAIFKCGEEPTAAEPSSISLL